MRAGGAAREREPPPAAVRSNRWRDVEIPSPDSFRPELPLSVVVPYCEQPGELSLLLASLERQTYPRSLFEVVVVDDGSATPLKAPPSTPLDVKVMHQADRGFGLARARNTGARAAAHGTLVFVDADVILDEGCLAAHARWHHAVGDALTLGLVARVDAAGLAEEDIRKCHGPVRGLLAGRRTERPWSLPHFARTRDLLSRHDDHFRGMHGSNFGIRRDFYECIGASDESFTRYGGEDTELAYRAQVRGGLLVPVRDALVWHQGLWQEGREAKEIRRTLQWPKFAHLLPHELYRQSAPGIVFQVPKYVVTVVGNGGDAAATVKSLLAGREYDLVVRIGTDKRGASGGDFDADPRVRVVGRGSPLDDFPSSPFHVRVPAGADVPPGLVGGLRAILGPAAVAESALPDGSRVSIARAWALHRARRAGGRASDFGDAVRTSSARLLREARRVRRPEIRPMGRATGLGDAFRRLRYEAAMVRTPRQVLALSAWLAGIIRKRASGGRGGSEGGPASGVATPRLRGTCGPEGRGDGT